MWKKQQMVYLEILPYKVVHVINDKTQGGSIIERKV